MGLSVAFLELAVHDGEVIERPLSYRGGCAEQFRPLGLRRMGGPHCVVSIKLFVEK